MVMPAAALFKLFGFDITWKVLRTLGIGIVAAIVIYMVFDTISDHFKKIDKLSTQNEQLKTKVTKTEGQRDLAIDINEKNQEAAKLEDDIQDNNQEIAIAERAAATARAQTYKEIRNAIQDSPAPITSRIEEPVASVITNTLDRLWNDKPSGTGSPNSNP